MARKIPVDLGDHFTEFVNHQIELDRYASVSEVVQAGLRLLEEHETQLDALRAALSEGERSGDAEPIDLETFLDGKRSARKKSEDCVRPPAKSDLDVAAK